MKLLFVVPVLGLVFLTISAYKEIPGTAQKSLPDDSSSTPISESNTASAFKSNVPPPPPPPPPSTSDLIKESGETPFAVVEEMPVFPGGPGALLKFISENTQYPASAKEINAQGRVVVRFCITAEGNVSQISVPKSVSPALDEEAN